MQPPPLQYGLLTDTTTLRLASNTLTGTLPTELGQLTRLTKLDLSYNSLSGSLLTEALGRLARPSEELGTPYLQLYVGANRLSGTVATQLGDLARLTKLYLSENTLSGFIPTELGRLTTLSELFLGSSASSGSALDSSVTSARRNNYNPVTLAAFWQHTHNHPRLPRADAKQNASTRSLRFTFLLRYP